MRDIDEGRNTVQFRVCRKVSQVKRWVPVPVDKEISIFMCKHSCNTHNTRMVSGFSQSLLKDYELLYLIISVYPL